MTTSIEKPRKAWLAALLSLPNGPLGQIYAGRFRRSVILWLVGVIYYLVIAISSILLPLGSIGFLLLIVCALLFPIFLSIDAFKLAQKNRTNSLKSYQRWWIYVLVYLGFCVINNMIAYWMISFVVQPFVVPTRSMAPSIQPGDHILADKFWFSYRQLKHGDIVLFRSGGPDSPPYIMRVAALPGDEIQIENEHVMVNGIPWNDANAIFKGRLVSILANYGPVIIPPDSCFVLGDNRRLAKDSRMLGPISFAKIYGKARTIYWSRTRNFPNPNDTSDYTLGMIRWDRIGSRLD